MATLKTLTWRRGAVVAAIVAAGVSGLALPADATPPGHTFEPPGHDGLPD
ncbi:hypothetical protein [Actinacidiphila glaucinigra]|nr:hypothetical protein [Actinacidiphila glaucinigra]